MPFFLKTQVVTGPNFDKLSTEFLVKLPVLGKFLATNPGVNNFLMSIPAHLMAGSSAIPDPAKKVIVFVIKNAPATVLGLGALDSIVELIGSQGSQEIAKS